MTSINDHRRYLAIATIAYHSFALLVVALIIGGVGFFAALSDAESFLGLGIAASIVIGVMLIVSLPGIVAGIGLLREREWGRILTIIVNALPLLSFPIGTALAAYTFWVLIYRQDELVLD